MSVGGTDHGEVTKGGKTMDESTDWEYDEESHVYTREIRGYLARTWEDHQGRWMTQVTIGNRGVSGNGFSSMAEAVAWCEDQAAQFITSDSRGRDSEAGT